MTDLRRSVTGITTARAQLAAASQGRRERGANRGPMGDVLASAMLPQSHPHARSRPPIAASHEISSSAHRVDRTPRLARQPQAYELALLAGLASLFVVNAVAAILEPTDITGLVERSLVGRTIPAMSGRGIAWLVAANDVTIGAALLATMWVTRLRRWVLGWAGAWLLAVAFIKLTSLEDLGG